MGHFIIKLCNLIDTNQYHRVPNPDVFNHCPKGKLVNLNKIASGL